MRSCFIYIYSYAILMSLVCTRMYSYVIRMSLVHTHMSSVCHSYVLVCHSYVTRIFTHMSSVCHSYVLICHWYVTRMYSYVIRMSLSCTRMYSYVILMSLVCACMSFVCHSSVVYQEPYQTYKIFKLNLTHMPFLNLTPKFSFEP